MERSRVRQVSLEEQTPIVVCHGDCTVVQRSDKDSHLECDCEASGTTQDEDCRAIALCVTDKRQRSTDRLERIKVRQINHRGAIVSLHGLATGEHTLHCASIGEKNV